MGLINNKTQDYLNSLISINFKTQSGYKSAAEKIKNENLKEIFVIYIQKKSEYIDELKRLSRELFGRAGSEGDFPFERYSLSSSLDKKSPLKKCEYLEKESFRKYKDLLKKDIPSNMKETLLKQYNGIREAQHHIKSLEGQY